MTDIGTGFLQAISAFGATRLGRATETSWKDAKSLVATLGDGLDGTTKPAWERLKSDVEAEVDLVKPIIGKIEGQLKVIAKMAADAAADAGRMVDAFGKTVFDIDHTAKKLADQLTFGPATGEAGSFRLAARLGVPEANFGVLRLNQTVLEAFVSFSRRQFLNPTDEEKKDLVERENTWWWADQATFGFRVFTYIRPGIQQDPLLSKIMPGSAPPATVKPTAVTLDTTAGLSFGDGLGTGNEKIVLPVQFDFPAVEVREPALGLVRNKAHEVTGPGGLPVGRVAALAGCRRRPGEGSGDQRRRLPRTQTAHLRRSDDRRVRRCAPAGDPQGRRLRHGHPQP